MSSGYEQNQNWLVGNLLVISCFLEMQVFGVTKSSANLIDFCLINWEVTIHMVVLQTFTRKSCYKLKLSERVGGARIKSSE
jgi:hypothetical protein